MPDRYALIFSVLFGLFIGIGAFTFIYAKGYSYVTDDPAACSNCHIMNRHFDSWLKGSHRAVAVCNDCHTPANFFGKYATKASNGFWHSFAFTTGKFPDPLRIKPHNLEVAEDACRKCHQDVVAAISPGFHLTGFADRKAPKTEPVTCTRCHDSVGHVVR
jgi:cytochrome c nitrite reductase small subunit